MTALVQYARSTIGQKQLMGLAGLLWSLFLLTHMLANLLIIFSPEAYNKYSHALVTNPLIYVAEAGLVGLFLLHALKGMWLTYKNREAKKRRPAQSLGDQKKSSFAVQTMIYQGVIIGVFLVLHLLTFKFGTYYEVSYNGVVMRDLYRLVFEVFQQPVYVFGYIICMIVLWMHLSHGFYSSIQTLGFHHPVYSPKLKLLGHIYAVLVAVGFMSQPFYVFFIAPK